MAVTATSACKGIYNAQKKLHGPAKAKTARGKCLRSWSPSKLAAGKRAKRAESKQKGCEEKLIHIELKHARWMPVVVRSGPNAGTPIYGPDGKPQMKKSKDLYFNGRHCSSGSKGLRRKRK